MRRILFAVLLLALASSIGCTAADKQQWHQAVGDLNGDNVKSIAPISKKSSD